MNRRSFLAALPIAMLAISPAWADDDDEDYVDDIVEAFLEQGYIEVTVTRTFLGRIKIVGKKANGRRELVCNPRTGEILRDVWIDENGDTQPPLSASTSSGTSGSSSGDPSGKRHGGDDDHDDDDDDDDDDDNGGKGRGRGRGSDDD